MFRKGLLITVSLCVFVAPIIKSDMTLIVYGYGGLILFLILFDLTYLNYYRRKRYGSKLKPFKCHACNKESYRKKYAVIHTCMYCKNEFVLHADKKMHLLEDVEMNYCEAVLRLIYYVVNRDDVPSKSQPEFIERLTYYLVNKDQKRMKDLQKRLKNREELNLRRILYELNQHNLSYSNKDSLVKVLLDISTLDHKINQNVYRAIKKIIHYYDLSGKKYERLNNELSSRNEFPYHLDLYNLLFSRIITCSNHPEEFDFNLIKSFYDDIGFEERFLDRIENRIENIESSKRIYIIARQIYNQTKSKAFSNHLFETILRLINQTQSINKIQQRDLNQIRKALNISNEENVLIMESIM